MTTTTTALEQQITALLCKLKEMKDAERLEAARKEAEAPAEKAYMEEEQRRLQAEAEHARHDAEERRAEQEKREREQEEEARRCRSWEESTLTPLVASEMELPKSKGKGLELVPELEGGQESRRCNSCEKRNVECVRIKVSIIDLETPFIDSLVDRKIPLLSPLPGAKDPVLHQRWSSSPAETATGGGPW